MHENLQPQNSAIYICLYVMSCMHKYRTEIGNVICTYAINENPPQCPTINHFLDFYIAFVFI